MDFPSFAAMRLMASMAIAAAALTTFKSTAFCVLPSITSQKKCRKRQFFGLIDANFDYSSTRGWNEFWRHDAPPNETLEWHSSVPFSTIIQYIPRASSCLIIGCGNSVFPRVLYDEHRGDTLITCLDSSSIVLDQLRGLHSKACPNITFVCGDAIRLSKTLGRRLQEMDVKEAEELEDHCLEFQTIVDKGFTDVILCGEGWDAPLQQLLSEAASVLSDGGNYILISYRLGQSRMEFLEEVGGRLGLTWLFNVEGTTDKVSVSIATKRF